MLCALCKQQYLLILLYFLEFPLLLLSFKEDQLISLKDLQKLLIEPMLVVLKKFSETLRHVSEFILW